MTNQLPCPTGGATVAVPRADAAGWYFRELLGPEQGPVSFEELLRLARTGEISPYTRVSREPAGHFELAYRIEGLFR